MRTVIQEDQYGCGAAVIAMLLGINYAGGAKLLFPQKSKLQKRAVSTTTGEIVRVLVENGLVERERRRISSKARLGDLTLDAVLSCRIHCDGDVERLHFMAWDVKQKVVRDPLAYKYPFRLTSYIAFAGT